MKIFGWIIGAGLAAATLFYVFLNPQGTSSILNAAGGAVSNYNKSLRG